jgi:hypothetical protein
MTGVRFADVQARPAEFLNLTSLTLEAFNAQPLEKVKLAIAKAHRAKTRRLRSVFAL